MLNDDHVKIVFYEQKSADVFPGTDIKGGVVVLYRDVEETFGAIGTFTSFDELNSIVNRVLSLTTETLNSIITGRGIYRLTDKALEDYPQIVDIQSRGHKYDVGTSAFEILEDLIFFADKPENNKDYVSILGRYNGKRVFRWIRSDYINEPFGFNKWCVVLPKSNGTGVLGEALSTPLILEPLVGFTETFISIGAFDTEDEAENCLKYVKSKFARTMLGVLKITQDNTREKWAKVPIQDFTSQSDIDWGKPIPYIDQQLYSKYGLDEKEIAFIEEKAVPME